MGRVRVWVDVLTPKQALLFGTMVKDLQQHGYSVLLTARDYDYTLSILRELGLYFRAVGGYSEGLREKIVGEARRTIELLAAIDDFDALLAFPNPVASRIAYGLRKPYVALTDSPHSEAPSRLSLPLSSAVVFSYCIPEGAVRRYLVSEDTPLIRFRGVDEVQWLKGFTPQTSKLRSLGLTEHEYAIARPPEFRASYYTGREKTALELFERIVRHLLEELNMVVVYLPRYDNDPVLGRLGTHKRLITVPKSMGVVARDLSYYASLVVTGGATMAREAALLGTPGLCLYPEELYVNKCLAELGLPLLHIREGDHVGPVESVNKVLRDFKKDPENFKAKARAILEGLEKPSEGVLKALSMVIA